MKPRLLDLLACPLDRTPLELVEWESRPVDLPPDARASIRDMGLAEEAFARDVVTGVLLNRARRIYYPIVAGVPRLLVFPTAVARGFARDHRERLARELPGFALPDAPSAPGEADVLRSFSSEWVDYDWDDASYWNLTPDAMYRSMRFMLDLDRRPLRGQLVLEMGIGIGGIANYVQRSEGCELVGVDLSHAADAARKNFGANPLLHVVQASVFAPPFPDARFDFVYSQGVIHHTYSTRTAFERLARLPRKGGRLYVWVYSPFDESRTPMRRALMALERVIRPVCWRLPEKAQTALLAPVLPLYMAHSRLQARSDPDAVPYGWREALHAARDRFTPRYIHRHTDEEVAGWFAAAGYESLQVASRREKPDHVPVAFVACAGVDGVRAGE